MLAISYERVSSTGQVAGLGLERQAAAPQSYCAARGWQLWEGEAYSDAGRSAFDGSNLEASLGRFLADLRAGRFGPGPVALLVEDLDRFSRSFPLAVLPVIIDDLLNCGITIAVMAKGRDISRASIKANGMELHELLFWLGSAHEFSARLSRRLSHVHAVKRDRIRTGAPTAAGSAPCWISLIDGRWQFNSYAATVRRVLDLVREHGGGRVASILNSEGVPPPSAARQQRAGAAARPRLWSSSSVLNLIGQPAIYGARQILAPGYRDEVRAWKEARALARRQGIPADQQPPHPRRQYETPQLGYYPALLTQAEHEALLLAMRSRRQQQLGRTDLMRWLGGGLTVCSCGAAIVATCSTRSNGQPSAYLRCQARFKGGDCRQPFTPLRLAQAALLTRLAADDYLAMLEARGGASRATAHSQALAQRDAAAQALEQAQAVVAAGEHAMASVDDPAVLVVLARRQAAAALQLEQTQQELAAATLALQQLQGQRSIEALGAEAQQTIRQLLATFSAGAETVEDRRLVHGHLRRLGLRIHVDGAGRAMGLQLGGGPIDWQPLDQELAGQALAAGVTGAQFFIGDADGLGAGVEWPA
jgi:DNA invertase Pin-like site-specific DNA recombinase